MNELARQQPATISSITDGGWTRDQVDLVKRTVIHGVGEATDDELHLFEYVCHATGLNPFLGQIWGIRRKEQIDNTWQERMTIQVGIAGYRLIAERTSRYEGRLGPYWCGADGQWRDVWLDSQPPAACKVGILKAGFREPLWAVATFAEFAQRTRNDQLTRFWRTMPANQLAKCAMAMAFREAFPQETAGVYSDAELPDAEESPSAGAVTTTPAPALATTPSVPTLDQIHQVEYKATIYKLIGNAPASFREHIKTAVWEMHNQEAKDFQDDATVDDWKQVLEYAVELHEQQQHETSAAGSKAPPAPAADPPSAPGAASPAAGSDPSSNPGRADRRTREGSTESAMTPGLDDPAGGDTADV